MSDGDGVGVLGVGFVGDGGCKKNTGEKKGFLLKNHQNNAVSVFFFIKI